MTNHSLPNGPSGPEGDSEKKKWGYKRQQFDAVVSTTRFNGAIDGLVSGTVTVQSLLTILDELNASNQRGRYMAEVLALKQESRRLATAPFDERVAEFLVQGSRRIPWLSDGLASQMAVALASAADNALYLDTVNTAVGNLLLDLDRPLKPDTRNFLRALTDKIDATRRLQEARGFLATVPSVYPPVIPEQLANAQSPEPPPVGAFPVEPPTRAPLRPNEHASERHAVDSAPEAAKNSIGSEQILAVGEPTPRHAADDASESSHASSGSRDGDEYEELEPTALSPGPQAATQRTLMMPAAQAPAPHQENRSETRTDQELRDATAGQTPAPPGASLRSPRTVEATPARTSTLPVTASHGPMPVPSRRPKARMAARAAPTPAPLGSASAPGTNAEKTSAEPASAEPSLAPGPANRTAPGLGMPPAAVPSAEEAEELRSLKIPTQGIPLWLMVAAAGGIAIGGAGLWFLLQGRSASNGEAPSSSASISPSAAARTIPSSGVTPPPPAASPPAASPPPVAPPPAAAQPTVPKSNKPAVVPLVRSPAPPAPRTTPVSRAATPSPAPPTVTSPRAVSPARVAPKRVEPVKPEPPAPKPKAVATSTAVETPAPVPVTPKPSRTIDDILVELLQVPNDPAMIEAKAHEVARIVARSARPDAEHILQRLIPEEVLAGTETVDTRALEPVRRVVALLLKKVALDKDDSRAAMAIDSLGEWAKLRKHGAAAKLTLDELAESPVVLSRPQRLRALERVQARLGISNAGE